VNLSGRFFDFYLPEEGIVLELDGTIHFHSEFFENDDRTAYRNLHLVHAGYKLIVITIHEYNSNREVPQLMELFVSKLNLMREEHCVAVL
jgi:very-short-patch-repair endonuclease